LHGAFVYGAIPGARGDAVVAGANGTKMDRAVSSAVFCLGRASFGMAVGHFI
jgi:hypothetical protein